MIYTLLAGTYKDSRPPIAKEFSFHVPEFQRWN